MFIRSRASDRWAASPSELRVTELSTSSCLTPGVKWSKVGKRKRKKPVFLLAGSSPTPYDVTPGLRHSLRWKVASWRRSCRSS